MHTVARKAIILAAGSGRRLGLFGANHPKPLLPINGTTILDNCLTQLAASGIAEAVLVVGHRRDQIMEAAGSARGAMRIRYVVAEDYATTNNIVSLWRARQDLNEDVLLLEADIFFDGALLPALLRAGGANVAAVARFQPGMNGAVVTLDAAGAIARMVEGKEQGPDFDYSNAFKTVNIYRLGRDYLRDTLVPALERAVRAGRTNDYYESLFKADMAASPGLFRALDCTSLAWYEIDDHEDKRAAEYAFLPEEEKLSFIAGQYGGYWRYGFADHAYIYNLHFPPPEMWQRMASRFEDVARPYPVGQRALAECAADAFGKAAEHLLIANGASELIRIICGSGRRIIVPVPSFNEYENATPGENLVRFPLPAPDFTLDVDAFAAAAQAANADIAVVVSPNNPTSLAVAADDVLRLARRLRAHGITLLLDESFIDFCEGSAYRSLEPDLGAEPNLAILKSLSKAFGIAGLRLGYLATANAAFAKEVRAALPIWNVNGFGELFLRLLPRYRREFVASCDVVRAERNALWTELTALGRGHVYRPQANFLFWRLPEPWTAPELVTQLFVKHGILIKGCKEKSLTGSAHYVRVSARTAAENKTLVAALRQVLAV